MDFKAFKKLSFYFTISIVVYKLLGEIDISVVNFIITKETFSVIYILNIALFITSFLHLKNESDKFNYKFEKNILILFLVISTFCFFWVEITLKSIEISTMIIGVIITSNYLTALIDSSYFIRKKKIAIKNNLPRIPFAIKSLVLVGLITVFIILFFLYLINVYLGDLSYIKEKFFILFVFPTLFLTIILSSDFLIIFLSLKGWNEKKEKYDEKFLVYDFHDRAYQLEGKIPFDFNEKYENDELLGLINENSYNKVDEILNNGVNPNFEFSGGWTPLMLAVANNKFESTKALIDHGADINVLNKIGNSPLFFASKYGFKNLVKLLLDNKANPNIGGITSESPLQIAAYNGHEEIVEMLLNVGANKELKTILDKKTALDLAMEKGHGKIAKILRVHGK